MKLEMTREFHDGRKKHTRMHFSPDRITGAIILSLQEFLRAFSLRDFFWLCVGLNACSYIWRDIPIGHLTGWLIVAITFLNPF